MSQEFTAQQGLLSQKLADMRFKIADFDDLTESAALSLQHMVETLEVYAKDTKMANCILHLLDTKTSPKKKRAAVPEPKPLDEFLPATGLKRLERMADVANLKEFQDELMVRRFALVEGEYSVEVVEGRDAFCEPNMNSALDVAMRNAYSNISRVKYAANKRKASLEQKCQMYYEASKLGRRIRETLAHVEDRKEKSKLSTEIQAHLERGPRCIRSVQWVFQLAKRVDEMCMEVGDFFVLLPDIVPEGSLGRIRSNEFSLLKSTLREKLSRYRLVNDITDSPGPSDLHSVSGSDSYDGSIYNNSDAMSSGTDSDASGSLFHEGAFNASFLQASDFNSLHFAFDAYDASMDPVVDILNLPQL